MRDGVSRAINHIELGPAEPVEPNALQSSARSAVTFREAFQQCGKRHAPAISAVVGCVPGVVSIEQIINRKLRIGPGSVGFAAIR
jgi:hypothetical protein